MAFVDRVILFVQGGAGGDGCLSFRREKYVPRGGPDGGDGGDGGDVIVRTVAGTDNLASIINRKHWRAPRGGRGGPANRHGRNGKDLIIRVPPGTVIRDRERGHVLRDLTRPGEQVVVAHGGQGGLGNKAFATATNQAPREIKRGEPGEERWIILELKLIADAGLVGLPNAGKSTLLSRLSRAHPEIADYPFTTKHPNLGLVMSGGERAFVLADLPGLIEGAHSGIGLGHEFLRHVERNRVLIHLVEPTPLDGSDPLSNYRTIRRELELYPQNLPAHRPWYPQSEEAPGEEGEAEAVNDLDLSLPDSSLEEPPISLADKLEIVAVSKAELPEAEAVRRRLEQELGKPVLAISAVTGAGLPDLVRSVTARLQELAEGEGDDP
jgi:GTP-binding protein